MPKLRVELVFPSGAGLSSFHHWLPTRDAKSLLWKAKQIVLKLGAMSPSPHPGLLCHHQHLGILTQWIKFPTLHLSQQQNHSARLLPLSVEKCQDGTQPQTYSPDWLRVRVLRTTGMKSRKLLFPFFSKEPEVMCDLGAKDRNVIIRV